MTTRDKILAALVVFIISPGWFVWNYGTARKDCYFYPNGDIKAAQVLNACVADSDSNWKLPKLVHGFGVMPFLTESMNCRAEYLPALFFIEKEYACDFIDKNKEIFLELGEYGQNPIHDLARRHGACGIEGEQCFIAQIRSLELLLDLGLDIDIGRRGHRTALEIAAVDGDVDFFKALIARGADLAQFGYDEKENIAISLIKEQIEWCREQADSQSCSREYREILEIIEGR